MQDLTIDSVQSNNIVMTGNLHSSKNVTIMVNKNESSDGHVSMESGNYVLSEGVYNYTIPTKDLFLIRISGATNVILTGLSKNNNIIGINLKNDTNSFISYEKKELNILLENMETINKLEIVKINTIEGFDGSTDVKNTCHYVCSNLNITNILFVIGFILLMYYFFVNQNKML